MRACSLPRICLNPRASGINSRTGWDYDLYMDAELKQYLDGMAAMIDARLAASEERMTSLIDGRLTASEDRMTNLIDARLAAAEDRMTSLIDGRLTASEKRMIDLIDGRLDAAEDRMKEFTRKADFDLETKLIAEFWKWGRASDIRTREIASDSAATAVKAQLISERLLNVEDRVSALERNRPPQ